MGGVSPATEPGGYPSAMTMTARRYGAQSMTSTLRDVLVNGGLVTAVGGSAAAMCDPMVDPRGGAFTLGLGLVPNLALVTEAEHWSPERLHRTRKLANTAFAVLRSGDALVRTSSGWETVGNTEVHGELP